MSGLSTAKLGLGIAEGFSGAIDYERERPEREARLAEAKLRKERAQQALGVEKKSAPLREAELEQELAEVRANTYKTNASLLQTQTYDAFRKFGADGDVRHLNNFIQSARENPMGRDLYSGIARVDTIQATDKFELKKLFLEAGIEDLDAVLADPTLSKDFVVLTDNQGGLALSQLSRLKAATGYNKQALKDEVEELDLQAKKFDALHGPVTEETKQIRALEKILRDAGHVDPLGEAIELTIGSKKGALDGTAIERLATAIQKDAPELSRSEAMSRAAISMSAGTADEREALRVAAGGTDEEFLAAYRTIKAREGRTSTQKNAKAAYDVRKELDSLGADGSFFTADLSDKLVRRKAGPKIIELEQLTGKELTNEDKRVARDIRDLINLGGTAGAELTGEETGLLDSLLSKVKKYTTDKGGEKGTAAYETFRNIFRNALYGASLTNGETSAFNAAAGTLGQKLGPVLEQLNGQMTSLRNQLSAIYDMNDEYVTYYYLGLDREELDRRIEAIDQRIAIIKQKDTKKKDLSKEKVVPGQAPKPTESARSKEEDMQILSNLAREMELK